LGIEPNRPKKVDDSNDSFYRDHFRLATAWATALTGRSDIGEDLAQEALLKTIERLGELDNPTGYLRIVVVNECRMWHRSASRERRRSAHGHNDNQEADLSDRSSEVLELLDDLPYQHRAAIILRYWAGWDDAAIAQALSCRRASVRVFVHRGLAALRRTLRQEDAHEP
jgi:RNA polymerase sigma factor (sigma-70 family)